MQSSIARRLLRLNRDFYDAFAGEFAASRESLQPGIRRALQIVSPGDSVLDAGCGDGRVGRALLTRGEGRPRRYLGIDVSERIIERALGSQRWPEGFAFVVSDLVDEAPAAPIAPGAFDVVLCFSMLHHIPGTRQRAGVMRTLHSALRPGGTAVVSVWQYLHIARLAAKIQPWSLLEIDLAELEAGDHLLDWQRGGSGLRYVHHFDEDELLGLAVEAGFSFATVFRSDGKSGDLGLYVELKI